MEIKSFELEFKAVGEEGIIEGYASTFGNVDEGMDKVVAGAFAKSLRRTKGVIPILADHNSRTQIGWNMEAFEDQKGLKVKGKLDLNVQAAVERLSLAKTAKELGGKMGLSIGYAATKVGWEGEVRLLKEIDLREYSFVAFPMNRKANVTSIKNLLAPDGALIDNIRTFEEALRDVGFSNQQAKAIASFSFKLRGQCDADEVKMNDLMESITRATKIL